MLPVGFIVILMITFNFSVTRTHEIKRKPVPVFGVNFISTFEEKDEEFFNSSEQINLVNNSKAVKQKASCECENGTCVTNADGRTVCQCPPEFYLNHENQCKACNCGPGANCTINGSFIRIKSCICKEGYKEDMFTCIGPCTVNPCKNGGTCVDIPNTYKCSCPAEYTGVVCERKLPDPCSSEPCQNGGECTVDMGTYKCACKPGYFGENCEMNPCSSDPCENGGECEIDMGTYKCTCMNGYSGRNCEINPCSMLPCQNDGICSIEMGNYSCICKPGFFGKNCENECVCKGGECIVNEYGETVCQCPPGYANYTSSECRKCNCGDGSDCAFSRWGEKFCFCKEGYVQEKGKCEICSCGESSINCTVNHYGEKVCICKDGYVQEGGKCEDCNCGPNAGCRLDAYDRKICFCLKGYRYVDGICKGTCTPNPCQNEGKCIMVDGNYNCTCKFPYSGRKCERVLDCSCGQNGDCSFDIYGRKICNCRYGFAEFEGLCKECSCGSHSFCFFNKDGDRVCVCDNGYTYNNGKCEEGNKESIVVPILLGAILVSILFGILLFTCILCRKK